MVRDIDIKELKSKILMSVEEFQSALDMGDKSYLRNLHIDAKRNGDADSFEKAIKKFRKYQSYFKEPSQIDINKINATLVNVDIGKPWSDLFNIVRRSWSMPFNKGYGRRLRYVVYDKYNESVIGIIGLQSPPADLACRDELFNYPKDAKLDLVNQTMDIYSLGSIPPYSGLIGGKLVAGLAASKTVYIDYAKKYRGSTTILNSSKLDSKLVALTTTSAFGRSSIYNRLKFKDRLVAEPIGYTKGYGSIHLEAVYSEMKELLLKEDKLHNGGFGRGPKQRWQNIVRTLQLLDLPSNVAKHGVNREVFLFRLVDDLESGMAGERFGNSICYSEPEFSEFWKDRWAIPRSKRRNEWRELSTEKYMLKALKADI